MTIQQFIEKAVEGGLEQKIVKGITGAFFYKNNSEITIIGNEILLDPLTWQSVGKVENWETDKYESIRSYHAQYGGEVYTAVFHGLIDALCEGKTIEQFLETL